MKLTDLTKVQETYEESLNKAEDSVSREYVDSKLGISDNYTKTILWENPSGMTVVSPITLVDDYTNYDVIVFELAINSLINIQQFTIDTAAFETNVNCCLSYQGKSMGIVPTTSTSLTAVTWDGGNTYVIQKIYGVKLGARRPYKETTLWTNPTSGYPSPQGSVEIINSILNYDAIYVVGGTFSNNTFAAAPIGVIPISEFVKGEEFLWEYDNLYYGTNYVDDTHIHLGGVATGGRTIAFKEVIGITYGGTKEIYEIGKPNYDARIQFVQNDLPYTVPCDGYLHIGGYKSNISLKYKDTNNEYIMLAHAGNNSAISEYTSFPVTKGMVLEYNEISGSPYMYIIPLKYQEGYAEVDNILNTNSENPVQNKVLANKINELEQRIIALESRI